MITNTGGGGIGKTLFKDMHEAKEVGKKAYTFSYGLAGGSVIGGGKTGGFDDWKHAGGGGIG